MENFNDKLNELRTECYDYIRSEVIKQADKKNLFYLADPKEIEESTDALIECPVQYFEGRHSTVYYFYIHRIELISGNGLCFYGTDTDEGIDKTFLYDELETDCLASIATQIRYLNDGKII